MKANKVPDILEFYERYFQGDKKEGLPEYLLDAIKKAATTNVSLQLHQLRCTPTKSIYTALIIARKLLKGETVMIAHYSRSRYKDKILSDITKYFGVVPRIVDKTPNSTTLVFRGFDPESKLDHPRDLIIEDDPLAESQPEDRVLANKWITDVFITRKKDEDGKS